MTNTNRLHIPPVIQLTELKTNIRDNDELVRIRLYETRSYSTKQIHRAFFESNLQGYDKS